MLLAAISVSCRTATRVHAGHGLDGPNQCNVFIPTAVNQPAIREKATLHILDGLIAVYEGGPKPENKSWGTWRAKSLFFATDPVAMDHVGWDIIDTKRIALGLKRVGEVGRRDFTPEKQARMMASAMLPGGALDALTRTAAAEFVRGAGDTEIFDRRTPEHVILASMIGLGEFDLNKITYKRVDVIGERRRVRVPMLSLSGRLRVSRLPKNQINDRS